MRNRTRMDHVRDPVRPDNFDELSGVSQVSLHGDDVVDGIRRRHRIQADAAVQAGQSGEDSVSQESGTARHEYGALARGWVVGHAERHRSRLAWLAMAQQMLAAAGPAEKLAVTRNDLTS
jgi:hypothetical protein